ncbi:MAG TPA: pyridoxamine 5'-phosphate oxidase family protein [Candidatus Mediterraneibacter avicola]|nr:pyridoxamine 5'-phosphate oxidase family protein [Candidatus Mediterraneibacter avicola]
MREMRLKKREVTDPGILREILEECRVVRIGAMDSEGIFVVPVNYGYDFYLGDNADRDQRPGKEYRLTLYFHGAPEGRKAEEFASAPNVAVEMDCRHELITGDYTCSYSYAYRSIMGNGRVTQIISDEQKRYALSKIMEHMAPDASLDFSREMLERTAVFQIDVSCFTGKERMQKGQGR